MREFFKQIVLNLYVYCGNRQAEKMTDEELQTLYDSLERMSKIYSYIPEEKQKEIILTQLIADREYQNINVRTVSKWLDLNGKTYFKEIAHVPSEQLKPPLEGQERDAMLTMWQNSLKQLNENLTDETRPTGGGSRLREQIKTLPTEQPVEDPKLIRRTPSVFEEACGITEEMLNQNETLNEKGSEGTGEAPGISDDQSNTPEQNDSV